MNKNRAQNIILSTGKFDHERDYWLDQLAGDLPRVHFPYDSLAHFQQKGKWGVWSFTVPSELSRELVNLSNSSLQLQYIALLAIIRVLLYRYSGEEEAIIVAPVERQEQVGEYLNTLLLLRDQLKGTLNFRQVLDQVRKTVLAARANQNYPYNLLLNQLGLMAEDLFQIGFVFSNLQDRKHLQEHPPALVFHFTSTEGQFYGMIEYQENLYKSSTVEQLARHWLRIAQVMLKEPDLEIRQMDILSTEEREQVLRQFNGCTFPYPCDQNVVQMFQERVEQMPDHLAVETENGCVTYLELNTWANQIAHKLMRLGISSTRLVGVMFEPSLEIMAALLGILKAGGAYIPLDPAYPAERIVYMLNDARAEVLLTVSNLVDRVANQFTGGVLMLDDGNEFCTEAMANPDREIAPTDLAYCIYTSGSTGEPKGVLIEHQSLLNLVHWHTADVGITPEDRFGKYASFSFDASIIEIFPYITAGATLVMVPQEYKADLVRLSQWYREKKITATFLPTNLCEIMGREFPYLPIRHMLTGGDKLKASLQTVYPVINCYGPTENTCVSTYFRVAGMEEISQVHERSLPLIGRPVPNTQVYILDRDQNPVPVNVVGEICLAGVQLAREYVQKPAITAERFLSNPFEPGTQIYKTGDLGRWCPDGNLEFLGRIDQQVKIRGFRIEPGEVEARLLRHPAIQAVAVIPVPDGDGGLQLAGYLVLREKVKASILRQFLLDVLPDYMVPAVFISMDALPLTPNGKVDQRVLPSPEKALLLTDRDYTPPRNEVEVILSQIWAEILRIERVGIYDSFFELGGHSLKATQVISRIYKELGVQIPVRSLFQAANIANLAERVKRAEKGIFTAIQSVSPRKTYPLTHAQKRLWILDQLAEENIAYNMPAAFLLRGSLQPGAFRRAFQSIVDLHEILRTRFIEVGAEPVQVVEPDFQFQLDYRTEFSGNLGDYIRHELMIPFDLTKPCLLRASLTRFNPEEHLLITNMHHIISDGWSVNIMVQELAILYNAYKEEQFCPLAPLPIQYRDYAVWQHENMEKGSLAEQEMYWLKRLHGELTVLRLPYDPVDSAKLTSSGGSEHLLLSTELTRSLRALAQEQDTTLFTVITAAWNVLLYKLTGKMDIMIGVSTAGRSREQLERLIGFFVNTLVLRTELRGDTDFAGLLREVRDHALAMYENQDYPYDLLLERLGRSGHQSGELFTIMLNYLTGSDEPTIELDGLQVESVSHDVEEAKFDLSLYIQELPGQVAIQVLYKTACFTAETIQNWLSYWHRILIGVCANPEIKLAEIQIFSAEEYSSLLDDFNEDL